MTPREKKITSEQKLTSDCKPLTNSIFLKKNQNMLIKEAKVFHSRNSLNDSGPWDLLINPLETKCLIPLDNAFQCIKLFSIKYWLHIKRNLNLTAVRL